MHTFLQFRFCLVFTSIIYYCYCYCCRAVQFCFVVVVVIFGAIKFFCLFYCRPSPLPPPRQTMTLYFCAPLLLLLLLYLFACVTDFYCCAKFLFAISQLVGCASSVDSCLKLLMESKFMFVHFCKEEEKEEEGKDITYPFCMPYWEKTAHKVKT